MTESQKKISNLWMDVYQEIHEDIYGYKIMKPVISDWVEENIYLTKEVSRFTGYFSYDKSPYCREIIDSLHPSDPTRVGAVMKSGQSGVTQSVIVPAKIYIISQNPDNMLFLAGDKDLAKRSIRERFDPVMSASGFSKLIRPNVVRAKNQRTGDTDFSKEFAGGTLTVGGTDAADKMRQFSVKTVFADDWDKAPINDKKEGSIRKLIEMRQTSFGNLAKTLYVSTPTIKGKSNIEEVYLLGDQRKWNWKCPHCIKWIPIVWRPEMIHNNEDGKRFGGITYELNKDKRLIKESVHYKCQNCGGKILYNEKYDLNLKGKWIPTCEPQIEYYKSWHISSLIIPPGFTSWINIVQEWLSANPPGGQIKVGELTTFINTTLGETWDDLGDTPKIHKLMKNTRDYLPGIVPDLTCFDDGNNKIVMLTLSCDLNGIMNDDTEDVRLDWELLAHASSGATYSVDQGSIGTFKRTRDRNSIDKKNDKTRKKCTYMHGMENSVWGEFEKLIEKDWKCESGEIMSTLITVIDVGYFTRNARSFVSQQRHKGNMVFGVKGAAKTDFRKTSKDTPIINKSREEKDLYIVQVDQVKEKLSSYIKSRKGDDGNQPFGFMNFPQKINGKYTYEGYFKHYEGEKRISEVKNNVTVGYRWEKKHSQSQNHFWDVRVYNLAAVDIYIDLLRRSDSKLRNIDWNEFVYMVLN